MTETVAVSWAAAELGGAKLGDAQRRRDLLPGEIERPPQRLQGRFADELPGFRRDARLPFCRHLRHQIAKFLCHQRPIRARRRDPCGPAGRAT